MAARESADSRPEKTSYVTTLEGEKEFGLLLREAWWTVRPAVEPLIPAMSLMIFMSREELIRALQARVTRLESDIIGVSFKRDSIRDGATGADGEVPEHVREILDFIGARARAEIDWAKTFQKRLRDGQYIFLGEPGAPEIGASRGARLNRAEPPGRSRPSRP